jgi:HSP20 family molecular chaperone IbpA
MNLDNPTIQVPVGSEQRHPNVREDAEQTTAEVQGAYIPPIDIHEGAEGLTLEADLPGATERNLQIHLEDNVLNLFAKIDSPAPEGARLVHEEYRLGNFHRSFILSDEVDRERITAELRNGVLRLFLPKADRARTRRIEIKS